ncbi:unnamed protein product [Closterium sp. Naga37s-1]|nr:unnamed protein product [Closterium sp. Naga37s-1]
MGVPSSEVPAFVQSLSRRSIRHGMKLLPPIAAAALLLVAVAVAARVPAARAAGWVELDLKQTGVASDAALAQTAAGIAVEQYNAQTVSRSYQ